MKRSVCLVILVLASSLGCGRSVGEATATHTAHQASDTFEELQERVRQLQRAGCKVAAALQAYHDQGTRLTEQTRELGISQSDRQKVCDEIKKALQALSPLATALQEKKKEENEQRESLYNEVQRCDQTPADCHALREAIHSWRDASEQQEQALEVYLQKTQALTEKIKEVVKKSTGWRKEQALKKAIQTFEQARTQQVEAEYALAQTQKEERKQRRRLLQASGWPCRLYEVTHDRQASCPAAPQP